MIINIINRVNWREWIHRMTNTDKIESQEWLINKYKNRDKDKIMRNTMRFKNNK